MTFLTPLLAAGALFVAIPIALHLIMRRKPQPVVFPALRFVRNRQSQNQTRLKLRHLLLLALRCAVIALLALALARPILTSDAGTGGVGSSGSLAVVVDNALRMNYRSENQTRLEAAKARADWVLSQVPADRQVLVADLGSRSGGRLLDRDSARARISRIRTASRTNSLGQVVISAIEKLAEASPQRQDLFLMTDQTVGGLDDRTLDSMRQTLEQYPKAKLYLANLGAKRPSNLGVTQLQLSSESLAVGQSLSIQAHLSRTGSSQRNAVAAELWVLEQGTPVKRGEQLIEPTSGEQQVRFTLASLPEGIHQGYVRVLGGDPLPADDVRYFSVAVHAARRVLVVATTQEGALFVQQALAPSVANQAQVYQVESTTFASDWQSQLADFEAVWLLDPPGMSTGDCRTVANYVSRGGSTLIALGRNAELAAFNNDSAQQLLPGRLLWKSRDETFLSPVTYNHPGIAPLAEFSESIPWAAFPVFNYWGLDTLDASSVVVATFANGDPAIMERRLEAGLVLTMTTPLSDSANRQPWNLLPTGIDPWPFVALVDSLAQHMCGATEGQRNFLPGETALVPLGEADLQGYVLRLPSGDAIRQTLTSGQTVAAIGMTEELGNYRVQAGAGTVDAGFSVSPDPATSELTPRTEKEIAAALPKGSFRLTNTQQELGQDIAVGHSGAELYPWLITLVALTLAAENWVANRFYESS